MEVKDISLDSINVSELNTRKDLMAGTEDASLDDLSSSIKEKGLLTPIIVQKKEDGSYDLIAGQRRFLACKRLEWRTMPAIIREEMDDTDATIISLIENVHRADMSPIDKAKAYQRIHEKYNDHSKVARETGVSNSTVRKYLKLLDLADSIQEKLTTNDGPAGVGALSKLAETFSSPEEQEEAIEKIGGFKQNIQLEILNRSGGDITKLTDLKEEALEGAFDTRMCKEGLCFEMPEEIKFRIKEMLEKGESLKPLRDVVRKLK
jgi:ParB family transcriptional regulator, chromosome partitioning protein